MSSRTWIAKTSALADGKELASVIVPLMMAVNDLVVASDALGEWTANPKRKDRQQSAMLYYGSMMSHVYEALSIVGDIQKSASLTKAVENCDRQTRASFDAVAAFPTCPEYEMLAQIRNSTGFQLAKLGGQKSEQAPVLGSLLRLLLVLSLAPPQAGRSALAKSSVGADAVSDSSGEPRRDLLD